MWRRAGRARLERLPRHGGGTAEPVQELIYNLLRPQPMAYLTESLPAAQAAVPDTRRLHLRDERPIAGVRRRVVDAEILRSRRHAWWTSTAAVTHA